jgi:hypothetical protein
VDYDITTIGILKSGALWRLFLQTEALHTMGTDQSVGWVGGAHRRSFGLGIQEEGSDLLTNYLPERDRENIIG